MGIGVPGFIDIEAGVVIGSSNLPGFNDFPVRDEIQKHLGIPIILENDANAAALGEKWIGAGQNVNDLILLTLGTGIGGGVISRGKILHGSHGMAGEFQLQARVYGRAGSPCVRCGTTIRRIVQGQRATFFCPGCQRR